MPLAPATRARIENLLAENRIVLFMKGSRAAPQCGFSAATTDRLNALLEDYVTVDVLADEEIRQGIKEFGNWPTIPQLYVDRELVGGADIVQSMFDSGELHRVLGVAEPDRTPPEITISDAAVAAIRQALSDAGDMKLFLVVDGRFQPQFQLREAGGNEICVVANGLEVCFDLASAQRARGASIDWTKTPHGEGLAIHLPQAPTAVKSIDVHALKRRLDAGDITVIDVRPPQDRALAPFAHARSARCRIARPTRGVTQGHAARVSVPSRQFEPQCRGAFPRARVSRCVECRRRDRCVGYRGRFFGSAVLISLLVLRHSSESRNPSSALPFKGRAGKTLRADARRQGPPSAVKTALRGHFNCAVSIFTNFECASSIRQALSAVTTMLSLAAKC